MAKKSDTSLNFGKTVSLEQAARLIMSVPDNIICLEGEPGVGKSSILGYIAKAMPDYLPAYVDVPNLDLGDVAMPVVDKEKMVTRYAPNSRFRMNEKDSKGNLRPVAMMLDEYGKGPDPVKNMLHPLFEVKNRRLGDVILPPGSIVFLTSNLSSDGVGDNIKAHTIGRITKVRVRKPNDDEWLSWALNNDISPAVCAWVKEYPHALASYLSGDQNDNPYIFNPQKVQASYVSPRSLERASNILKARHHFDSDTLIAALSGTIGEAAARDMQAHVQYQDQLPAWEVIIKDPKGTPVPKSAGASAVLVYGAIMKIEKPSIDAFMSYLHRFEPEWQACFAINIAKNKDKQSVAFTSKAFRDWVQKNEDLL